MSRQALQRKLFEKNQKKQTMMSLNPLDGGGLNGLNLLHREPLGSIISHAGSSGNSNSSSSNSSSMRGGMGMSSGNYGASGGSFIDEEEEEEEDNMNQKYRDNKMSAISIGR